MHFERCGIGDQLVCLYMHPQPHTHSLPPPPPLSFTTEIQGETVSFVAFSVLFTISSTVVLAPAPSPLLPEDEPAEAVGSSSLSPLVLRR
eukprot:COSAG01_NODE_16387_length_1240_cov_1.079755_2_plen_90_part_00